jgi:hypothetical protein
METQQKTEEELECGMRERLYGSDGLINMPAQHGSVPFSNSQKRSADKTLLLSRDLEQKENSFSA